MQEAKGVQWRRLNNGGRNVRQDKTEEEGEGN